MPYIYQRWLMRLHKGRHFTCWALGSRQRSIELRSAVRVLHMFLINAQVIPMLVTHPPNILLAICHIIFDVAVGQKPLLPYFFGE